jgi:hypothetical protein
MQNRLTFQGHEDKPQAQQYKKTGWKNLTGFFILSDFLFRFNINSL